jgi:hypothetical protein
MQGGQVWPKRISSGAIDAAVTPVAPENPQQEVTEPTENLSDQSEGPATPAGINAMRTVPDTGSPGENSPPMQVPLSWPAVSAFFEAVGGVEERCESLAPAPWRGRPEPVVIREVGRVESAERTTLGQEQAWAVSVIALGTLVPVWQQGGKPVADEDGRRRQHRGFIR